MSVVAPVPRGTLGARMGRGVVDWVPAVAVFVLGAVLPRGRATSTADDAADHDAGHDTGHNAGQDAGDAEERAPSRR